MDAIERVREIAERLVVAIEFEVPPILDGADADARLRILLQCANEARAALAQPKADVADEVRAMCRRLREPISVRTSAPTNPDGPDAADLFERLTGVKE